MKTQKIKNFFTSSTGKGAIVACAALIIGLAVYLNYRWFYDPTTSLGFGENNMQDNFSDSENAGTDAENENDYFTSTALDRKEARDEAIDVLKMVSESESASEEARAEAMGVSATIVPTDVPTDNDVKHAARNIPAGKNSTGTTRIVSATVASTAPICLVEAAKAPARTKIHIISIMLGSVAPLE